MMFTIIASIQFLVLGKGRKTITEIQLLVRNQYDLYVKCRDKQVNRVNIHMKWKTFQDLKFQTMSLKLNTSQLSTWVFIIASMSL